MNVRSSFTLFYFYTIQYHIILLYVTFPEFLFISSRFLNSYYTASHTRTYITSSLRERLLLYKLISDLIRSVYRPPFRKVGHPGLLRFYYTHSFEHTSFLSFDRHTDFCPSCISIFYLCLYICLWSVTFRDILCHP